MKRIDKAWGHEEWFVNTELYCVRHLYLDEGMRCSQHYHTEKDETFFVVAGTVAIEVGAELCLLGAGDSVRVPPRVLHRFNAVTPAILLEGSTHHDDNDSYRVEKSGKIPEERRLEFVRLCRESGINETY